MNLTEDQILQGLRGRDPRTNERGKCRFKDICFIYPAILDDIQALGWSNFRRYLTIVTGEKPNLPPEGEFIEFQKILDKMTDLQFLFTRANSNARDLEEVKSAFYFFIQEDILFSDELGIIIGDIKDKRIIDETSFGEFSSLVKQVHYFDYGENEVEFLDSDSPHVRALKLKQIENKKKLARAKQKQRENGKDDDIQLSDLISSLAANGSNGISLLNIWDLSYYGFRDQLQRMNMIETYDMQTRAMLAGAKIDKDELKHWMQHLSPNNKT